MRVSVFQYFVDFDFFLVFNATFRSISAISWRPILVVEEARVPGESHRPWVSNWYALSLAAECTLFVSNPRRIGDRLV